MKESERQMSNAIPNRRDHTEKALLNTYSRSVPVAQWAGRLDFMASGDHENIFLYFSDVNMGALYRLCVFKNQNYAAIDGAVKFSEENTGCLYEIETGKGSGSYPTFLSAKRCDDVPPTAPVTGTDSPSMRLYRELKKAWLSDDRQQATVDYPELSEVVQFADAITNWATENSDLVPNERREEWVLAVVMERIATLSLYKEDAPVPPKDANRTHSRAHELEIAYKTLPRGDAQKQYPELEAVYEWERATPLYLEEKKPDVSLQVAAKVRKKILQKCFIQLASGEDLPFPNTQKIGLR